MRTLLAILPGILLAALSAPAVIFDYENTPNPGNNSTGTGAGTGWSYVGQVAGNSLASGVYLGNYGGNYWVLTANHVGRGNFTLGATTYNSVSGSEIRVKNADNSNTDLLLFRIDSDPGLAQLEFVNASLGIGDPVTMIGYGRGQETSLTYYDAGWNELPSAIGATYAGYKWLVPRQKQWGTNNVFDYITDDYGQGDVTMFRTIFNQGANEAQAAIGDSGGGVFYNDGGTWKLAGIHITIFNLVGQPANTVAAYGNATAIADIAEYKDFINSAIGPIPEPGAMALLAGASAGLLLVFRGRRRRLTAHGKGNP